MKEQKSKTVLESCSLSTNPLRCLGVFSAFWAIQELEGQSSTLIQWVNIRKYREHHTEINILTEISDFILYCYF